MSLRRLVLILQKTLFQLAQIYPVLQAQVFLLNRTDLKIKLIKQILKPQASQILGKLVHHQQLRMQHCLQT